MKTVTESIFDGTSIVPLADVQHIEKRARGDIAVIMKTTRYNVAIYDWDNAVHFAAANGEAAKFVAAWCRYRSELESETLADLSPSPSHANYMKLFQDHHMTAKTDEDTPEDRAYIEGFNNALVLADARLNEFLPMLISAAGDSLHHLREAAGKLMEAMKAEARANPPQEAPLVDCYTCHPIPA